MEELAARVCEVEAMRQADMVMYTPTDPPEEVEEKISPLLQSRCVVDSEAASSSAAEPVVVDKDEFDMTSEQQKLKKP